MKTNYSLSSNNSPKSFKTYPRGDFDLESGIGKKSRRHKNNPLRMLKALGNKIQHYFKLHSIMLFLIFLSIGMTILIILSMHEGRFRIMPIYVKFNDNMDSYPFHNFRNFVMVAGHSVYTSSSCEKVDKEDAWYLESYQKHPGQAATFIKHIQNGVEITANDDGALLLFSETRKNAGPRSEAQSYWVVAKSKGWFGKQHEVKGRALTEEHARDSFENLLFSVCRFRELTGTYPHNITVVGYDFKEERFAHLHRLAIGFPESRFLYTQNSREAALKGEALVRSQFQEDPYGCSGILHRKKRDRDPFHRSIPYPNGCPEIGGLFRYCGTAPYPALSLGNSKTVHCLFFFLVI